VHALGQIGQAIESAWIALGQQPLDDEQAAPGGAEVFFDVGHRLKPSVFTPKGQPFQYGHSFRFNSRNVET